MNLSYSQFSTATGTRGTRRCHIEVTQQVNDEQQHDYDEDNHHNQEKNIHAQVHFRVKNTDSEKVPDRYVSNDMETIECPYSRVVHRSPKVSNEDDQEEVRMLHRIRVVCTPSLTGSATGSY